MFFIHKTSREDGDLETSLSEGTPPRMDGPLPVSHYRTFIKYLLVIQPFLLLNVYFHVLQSHATQRVSSYMRQQGAQEAERVASSIP